MAHWILVTFAHTKPAHPDHEALFAWLAKHEVDVAWVQAPSIIKVTQKGITTLEYLHDAEGTLARREDGQPLVAGVLHECDAYPLPTLTHTVVGDEPLTLEEHHA